MDNDPDASFATLGSTPRPGKMVDFYSVSWLIVTDRGHSKRGFDIGF